MRIYLNGFTVIIFITIFISVNLAKTVVENKKNDLNITKVEPNMAKGFTPIQNNVIGGIGKADDGAGSVKKLEKMHELGSDVGRRIRKHFGGLFGPFGMMGGGYGFHALAILYWLKVKAVIIAFIIGTAIVWGAKYVWGNKSSCPKEVIHEGPIIPFSHGPMWSGHDHIPYSPSYASSPYDHHDHHISSDSFGSTSFLDSPPPSSLSGAEHFASEKKWKRASKRQSRQFESEEQISNIAFAFLGVDSDACRRRFVCEWEFRSKRSPITSLIFRVLGRGIFTKYLKTSNEIKSFDDCGVAHDECRFIEEHVPEKEYEDSQEEDIVNHSLNDDSTVPSSSPSSVSSQENDENVNENETETSTQTIQNDNENKEEYDHYSDNIVKNDSNKLNLNKVRKSQPEVKLSMNNYENQSQKKKKNIMAQALFNRSKSKLRVVPIRS